MSAPPSSARAHGHGHPERDRDRDRGVERPLSQQGMRRANLALVLGAVARLGATSRAQLAEATGLTRAAAGSLVSELIEAGLVREHGVALEGRVGRPSTVVSMSDSGPAGLGLDRKSTRLNSSHGGISRMPSSA